MLLFAAVDTTPIPRYPVSGCE